MARRETKQHKRLAYRDAVQATLVRFYQTPEADSKKIVQEWWKGLSGTESFKTGLFMHNEPMNTAADLAQKEVVPITDKVRNDYHAVLSESRYAVERKPLGRQGTPVRLLAVAEQYTDAKKESGKKKVLRKHLAGGA